ncbi:MAG: methyltransferase [Bifidobacterium sp.]|nr:methyltransferase [Bifidobacterium sp.]MCI1864377.1 methyltransferase [Bifidobacterium sp.]
MQATIRIERYADQGRCIAHIDGRVVFVRFALPGELVRLELDEPHDRDDRFWTGEVVEVLEPSADRVACAWPLAGPLASGGGVGGADLVHVGLEGQLRWKSWIITEQMRRLGHLDVDPVPVSRMCDDVRLGGLHWRTRIEMIADEHGHPSMHRRGSHVRVPVDDMPLASRSLLAVANELDVWKLDLAPGSQLRIAVPEPRGIDASVAGTRDLLHAVAGNYAVMVDGDVRFGARILHEAVTVDGREYDYQVAANGFWQMHRQAPVELTRHVVDLVRSRLDGKDCAVLWDLYSGSGLFTVPLATDIAPRTRILSVEGSRQAVKQAQRNLRRLNVNAVDLRTGDVASTLSHVRSDLAHPDMVVLDPPRAGARARVCRQIAASGAGSVIYIACDPTSLARDAATMHELGYALGAIRSFDIYPMTHHVETIALFTRGRIC